MTGNLLLVLPIFGVVALGWITARMRWLTPEAIDGLDRFVFDFAIPAFLFHTVSQTELPKVLPWGLWGSYYGSAFIVWATGFLSAWFILRRPFGDSAIIGFGSGFSNLVLLGLPIIVTSLGHKAVAPFFLILAFHSLIMYSVVTFMAEMARMKRNTDTVSGWRTLLGVIRAGLQGMARNVIILSLVLGVIWSQTGLGLYDEVKRFLDLLGQAGIPAALFAMGAMLTRYKLRRSIGAASLISFCKLVLHPLIAFLLAMYVFDLPVLWVSMITVMAAMPTGIFTFIIATRYTMAPGAASSAVVLSTLLGTLTIIVVLGLISP